MSAVYPARIRVVDSHTEGEPTRVVTEGWPQPVGATMAERRDVLRREQDRLRPAVICEPRSFAAVVGALLTPPVEEGSTTGVIFFNNRGYLGMCGHGLIGVVRTLVHLGRLEDRPGTVIRVDTPVGTVAAELGEESAVTITNVPSYCHARDVRVEVPGVGEVVGDVAWGGNWFFLAELAEPAVEVANLEALLDVSRRILRALGPAGVTGKDGAEIDHVELLGPSDRADARNFVLCPGEEYDRSPCGTGTSAKLAVLHERGLLRVGESWRQESILGGIFEGWLAIEGDDLVPRIEGRAFITAESTLFFDPRDPLRGGFDPR